MSRTCASRISYYIVVLVKWGNILEVFNNEPIVLLNLTYTTQSTSGFFSLATSLRIKFFLPWLSFYNQIVPKEFINETWL